MTGSNVIISSAAFIVVIPFGVLAAGIWVLIRRRHM